MKKIPLSRPLLCELALLAPPLMLLAIGLLCLLLPFDSGLCVLLFVLFLVLTAIYLIKNFVNILGAEILLDNIRSWQKDRLWFEYGQNGVDAGQVAHALLSACGKTLSPIAADGLRYQAKGVFHKRTHTLSEEPAAVDKLAFVYHFDYLSENDYRALFSNVSLITKKLRHKHKKKVTYAAAALLITADQVDPTVIKLVRKLPDFEEAAVVPCLYDGMSRRYIFDNFKEWYDLGLLPKPAKNYALDLIAGLVFGGSVPLKGNEHFDMENALSEWRDKTLGDLLQEFADTEKESKREIEEMASLLSNGELQYRDETLYLKHNDKLASFLTVEENDGKTVVLTDQNWTYPKTNPISKKDYAALKQMVCTHYAVLGTNFAFDDEE